MSVAEHLAIINAVADRRPADAERAIRAHLASVITALAADGGGENDSSGKQSGN